MPAPTLRYQRIWLAIGTLLVGLTIWFSLAQIPPRWTFTLGKDALHAASYGLITLWFGLIYRGATRQFAIACSFIALGISVEFFQPQITADRRFDDGDMLANSAGAMLAWVTLRTPVGGWLWKLDARLAGGDARGRC